MEIEPVQAAKKDGTLSTETLFNRLQKEVSVMLSSYYVWLTHIVMQAR
jgi:hypothetical protein